MKLGDAKRIVASYLVGQPVSRNDLQDACDTLNRGDREYINFLEEELGSPGEPDTLCEVFAERVAEFSEMSESERHAEMPELVTHLSACKDCQVVYREAYLSAFATSGRWAGKQLRRLAEPIHLALGWAGKLAQSGLGPIELTPAYPRVGAQMGSLELGPGSADQKEWGICLDEAAELVLRLTITAGGPRGKAAVIFALEGRGADTIAASDVALEVYRVQGERRVLRVADRLAAYRVESLVLEAGSWAIRLAVRDNEWEIPLVLDSEN